MKKFLGFLLLVQALWAAPALASIDYFLSISTIGGESTARGFEGKIDVNSWSWGLANSSGRPVFQDFAWTQGVDSSIVPLFLGAAYGTVFNTATFSVINTFGGAAPQVFFDMAFTNVRVTSLQVSGSGLSPDASATMDYEKIAMRYRPQDAKTGKLGPFVTGTFDTRSSKAAGFSGDAGVVAGLFSAGGSVSLAIVPVTTVPEPITWGMLLAGLMMIGGIVYQRHQTRSEAHGLPQAA